MSDETKTLIKLQYPDPYENFLDFYRSIPSDFHLRLEVQFTLMNALYFYYKKDFDAHIGDSEASSSDAHFRYWVSETVSKLEVYLEDPEHFSSEK